MPTVPFEIPGFSFTLESAGDRSLNQFKAVAVDASGNAADPGAGVGIAGVQQNKPDAAGKACEIVHSGISKANASAAVAQGDLVMVDANGDFLPATATNVAVGTALTAAANADEIFSVLLSGSTADL